MHSRRPASLSILCMICLAVLAVGVPAIGYHELPPAPTESSGERSVDNACVQWEGVSLTVLPGAVLIADQPAESDKPGKDQPKSDNAFSMQQHDEVWMLKKKIVELQNKGKLGFRKLVPCSSVEGYGVYSPMESGAISPNFVLYVEPLNYSTMVTQDRYIVDCTVDLILADSNGKVLGGKKGFRRINQISRSPILDLFYKIQIAVNKPLKQGFIIRTVLHDKIKNQSVGASFKVNVRPGGKSVLDQI